MKRLLYIAFFFPPLGGAGVQRSVKFVRYLPSRGWRPTVLTARSSYWMRDPSQLTELDPETSILRAPFRMGRLAGESARAGSGGTRPLRRIRILRSLARFLCVPDAYLGWVTSAAPIARRELARGGYGAILTTSSPDSAHLLGRHLKRRTGIPWVADFRDPWMRRLSYRPPTRWHDRAHHSLERSCLREADRVIVTTEETREDFLARYPELPSARIEVIPNGYDEEDFTAASFRPAAHEPASGEGAQPEGLSTGSEMLPDFSILHAGQLNPERPITPFLAGLRLFLEREPARRGEVGTLFLGGHYDQDLQTVRSLGLESVVRFHPGCPHRESVAALLRARALLLLEQDSDRGKLILPGKIFEYLRAGPPILALVPREGAADHLLSSLGAGTVVDPARPDSVAEGIAQVLSPACQEISGQAQAAILLRIQPYERRQLATRLAAVLDALPSPSSDR